MPLRFRVERVTESKGNFVLQGEWVKPSREPIGEYAYIMHKNKEYKMKYLDMIHVLTPPGAPKNVTIVLGKCEMSVDQLQGVEIEFR